MRAKNSIKLFLECEKENQTHGISHSSSRWSLLVLSKWEYGRLSKCNQQGGWPLLLKTEKFSKHLANVDWPRPTPLQKARRSYQTFIQKNTETELSRMAIHNWTIWPHFRAIANWHLHIDIHSKSSTFLKRFCRILHPRKLRHDNGNTNIWRCISWLPIVFHLSPS